MLGGSKFYGDTLDQQGQTMRHDRSIPYLISFLPYYNLGLILYTIAVLVYLDLCIPSILLALCCSLVPIVWPIGSYWVRSRHLHHFVLLSVLGSAHAPCQQENLRKSITNDRIPLYPFLHTLNTLYRMLRGIFGAFYTKCYILLLRVSHLADFLIHRVSHVYRLGTVYGGGCRNYLPDYLYFPCLSFVTRTRYEKPNDFNKSQWAFLLKNISL